MLLLVFHLRNNKTNYICGGETSRRATNLIAATGINHGETPHSMRAGCAVTLALTGSVDTKGMMDHIGWFSKRSTDYYSRSSKLIDSGNVANALAKSVNCECKSS